MADATEIEACQNVFSHLAFSGRTEKIFTIRLNLLRLVNALTDNKQHFYKTILAFIHC